MMQQMDHTRNQHMQLELFKMCVRTTLSQLVQITSSMEKQDLVHAAGDNYQSTKLSLFSIQWNFQSI